MDELIADRYRVLREIGRGGGGSVWLAQDERLGRQVALKRIHSMLGESSMEVARGMREARLAAALQHENIVAVYDIIDADDVPWLVMEYVDGPSLATMIERDEWLDPGLVARLGAQLAGAMSRAHEAGIIHRDIKPANILVARGEQAKLADFGIARAENDVQLTAEGLTSGTALYFSPEMADGAEPSSASDVWALGATLYYAVEGRPPIAEAGSQLATLRRIATTQPARPQHAGALAPVLAGMLDGNPRTRMTMPEAERALREITAGRSPAISSPARDTAFASTTQLPVPAPEDRTDLLPAAVPPAGAGRPGASARPGSPARPGVPARPGGGAGAAAARAGSARAGSGFGARPEPRRNNTAVIVLALVLLIALLAAAGLFVATRLGGKPAAPATMTTTSWSTQYTDPPVTTSTTTSSTSTTSTSTTPTSSSTSTTSTTQPPAPPTAGDLEAFAYTYLGKAHGDPETTWKMLTPGYQQRNPGGHDEYVAYWRDDVQAVETRSAKGDPADSTVTVSYRVTVDGNQHDITSTWRLVRVGEELKLDRVTGTKTKKVKKD